MRDLCRKFMVKRNHKFFLFLLTIVLLIFLRPLSELQIASNVRGDEGKLSTFTCAILQPHLNTTWYKPKALSFNLKYSDFSSCEVLTKGLPLQPDFLNCHRNSEIFASCAITNVQFFVPKTYPHGNVQLAIRARGRISHDDFVVPGLGLERRDFRKFEAKQNKDLKDWGEGAKRLGFSVSVKQQVCEEILHGITYMLRAYHMHNLGHFYETLFRVYVELNKRDDFKNLERIIFLNAGEGNEMKVPYSDLLAYLFPGVDILAPREIADRFICIQNAIFVGFPNHALGRSGTSSVDVSSFHNFLRRQFSLNTETVMIKKPLVVFMSRKVRNGARARRYLANEMELAQFIELKTKWDVRVVSMQELSFLGQAQLMFQTSVLISVHSAGFYNALYMRPGSIALQVNVAGTHFGTFEYESRPQIPLWRRGTWITPVEGICKQRGIIFLEGWSTPNFLHAGKFDGYSSMKEVQKKDKYRKWATVNPAATRKKWESCHILQDSLECENNMGNEMKAHSTADKLFFSKTALWHLLVEYVPCISDTVSLCLRKSTLG